MDELPLLSTFTFAVPFAKSMTDDATGLRYADGIASTDEWDQQDEQMVLGDGFDFTPLKKQGYINWNHSHKPEDQIGLPVECGLREHKGRPAFYVKTVFLPDVARADYVWNLMQSLEKVQAMGGPERQLGWSVEGGVLAKENGRITRAVIRHVAMTQEPVNAATFATICKGFLVPTDDDDQTIFKTALSGGDANPSLATSADAGAALRLENLSGGDSDPESDKKKKRRTADGDPLTSVLLSLEDFKRSLTHSPSPYYDARTGRFAKGLNGMYDHLTHISKLPPGAAADFINWLRRQT